MSFGIAFFSVKSTPAGGRRFLQTATGYLATIAGGQIIAENGALTGVRPGRLVRRGTV